MAGSNVATCATCGTPMPSDAPLGLCPRCLIESGARLVRERTGAGPGGDPDRTSTAALPEAGCIGDYELIEELGRGGMGVVFKARQTSLNRIVAVKTILAGEFATPAALLRFRLEAEAAATLRHPNIVAIYETGELDGRPYFSMEFVEGRNLESLAKERRISPEQAARYVRKIALAIQAAHDRGVLHRDLKPSNVLVDQDDEPRITDFGLAKRLQVDSDLTLSGQLLGSPNFMPPEQVSSHHGKVSVRSDIYALGATLYLLLTGHPPFQAPTVPETLRKVTDEEPPSPRMENREVPADLATICLKCLEKSPDRRYGSAREVAEELQRFGNGEPILAQPVGTTTKLWKFCRRKPVLAGLSAAVAALVLVLLVGLPIAWMAVREQRDQARALLYVADMNFAFQALKENNLVRVRDLLERHRPKPGEPDLRGWEWGHLWHESQSDEVATLPRLGDAVTGLAYSPDGRHLVSGGGDRSLRVWNVTTRQEITRIECAGLPTQLGFTPDGRHLVSIVDSLTGKASVLHVWEAGTWCEEKRVRHEEGIRSFAMAADGRLLAFQFSDGSVTLNDFVSGEQVATLVQPYRGGYGHRGLAVAANAPVLAALEPAGIGIWDLHSLRKVKQVPSSDDPARFRAHPMALSPDGRHLLAAAPQSSVTDLQGDAKPVVLTGSTRNAVGAAFSPNGDKLALADVDRTIRIWDTTSWTLFATLRGQESDATELAFSPDGALLASGGADGSIRFWNPKATPIRRQSADVPSEFRGFSATQGSTVLFWLSEREVEIRTGIPEPQVIRAELPYVPESSAAVSPDARFVCAERSRGQYDIWEVTTMQRRGTLEGNHAFVFNHRSFSPDGNLIVGGDTATEERVIWTVADGRERARIRFGGGERNWFSDSWGIDSRKVMLAAGRNLGLWDIERNRVVLVMPHGAQVARAVMSPDRRLIASLDAETNVQLWDAQTGNRLSLLGRRGASRQFLYPLSFSQDSRRLAVAGGLNGFRLYDLLTGHELGVPEMNFLPRGCYFSEDGRWLGLGSAPGFVYLDSTPFTQAEP